MRILAPTGNFIPFKTRIKESSIIRNTNGRSLDVDYIRDPLYFATALMLKIPKGPAFQIVRHYENAQIYMYHFLSDIRFS